MATAGESKGGPKSGSVALHVGSRVEVVVESLAGGGEGVARVDGRVLFVVGGAPGDRALIEITELARHHGRARLVEVRTAGPDRRTPPCRHANVCGGCTWQHVAPRGQRAAKARIVVEALARIAGIRWETPVEVLHGDEFHYRTRADLATTRGPGGVLRLGYRRAGSRQVEAVEECPVLAAPLERELTRLRTHPEVIPAAAATARLASGEEGVRALFADEDEMLIAAREFSVAPPREAVAPVPKDASSRASASNSTPKSAPKAPTTSPSTSRSTSTPTPISAPTRADSTSKPFPEPHRAGRGDRRGQVPLTEPETWTTSASTPGAKPDDVHARADEDLLRVHQSIGSLRYAFDMLGFWQGNHELVGELVRRAVGDESGIEALDLYCGAGLFSLPLAARFESVTGIESDARSIARARENAERNGVERTRFVVFDVEKYLRGIDDGAAPDLVLLDPPRRGAGPEVIAQLVRIAPKRVRYVSCDPATLARDLKGLVEGGYRLVSLVALDLVPQTPHVESVAVLERASTV